jgi:hypothetical protein
MWNLDLKMTFMNLNLNKMRTSLNMLLFIIVSYSDGIVHYSTVVCFQPSHFQFSTTVGHQAYCSSCETNSRHDKATSPYC